MNKKYEVKMNKIHKSVEISTSLKKKVIMLSKMTFKLI